MSVRHGFLAGLLMVALVSPATADWLVLREGGAIETDGAWDVRGKLVVFRRSSDGPLASLRLDAVDLEASERRTEAAKVPRPQPIAAAPPEVKAVLVLTDADVGHLDPRSLVSKGEASDGSGADEIAEGEEAPESEDLDRLGSRETERSDEEALRVVGWSRLDDPDFTGVRIGGTVQNDSTEVALNTVVTVRLTDENGQTIGRTRADLVSRALEPGASTGFEAGFSGIYDYSGVEFEPQSFNAVRHPPSAAGDEPLEPEI